MSHAESCPGKVAYRSRAAALLPLREAKKRSRLGSRSRSAVASEAYLCNACGMWHLGRSFKRSR